MIRLVDPSLETVSPSVVCLGFFDGVHLGHQALISTCKSVATQLGLLACVHTYDIPPMRLLKPKDEGFELTPLAQKEQLLANLGMQVLAISHFDQHMMRMRGTDFFEGVLLRQLRARHVVAGFDHHFGYRGETDVPALARLCEKHGVGLSVVPAVTTTGGQVVSSSAIRAALLAGDYAMAEAMLGRPPDKPLLERVQTYKDSFSL